MPIYDCSPKGSSTEVTGVTSFNNRTGAVMPQAGDYDASDVGAVDISTTVNGKQLNQNITLTANDVNADPEGSAQAVQTNLTNHINDKNNPHEVSAEQINAVPTSRTINNIALTSNINLTAANIPMSADDPTTVATELGNKAPAGFGLGGLGKHINDFNDANVTGWYQNTNQGAEVHTPDGSIGWIVRTESFQTDIFAQFAYRIGSPPLGVYQAIRYYHIGMGGWSDWEWVNPPLTLGVEYRTTERYLGKPVYVKLVDFGALPNNSTKLVEYAGGDNTTRTIEAHGVMSGGFVIPGSTGSSGYPDQVLEIVTNNNQVGVITHMDRSSYTAQFVVKYWRTSD